MCEHIEKKSTFKASQVSSPPFLLWSMKASIKCLLRILVLNYFRKLFDPDGVTILQLEDGDIICYQRALTREQELACRYPDVPSFLEYVRNRQVTRTIMGEIYGS